jgi:hypothetical protein
VLADWLEVDVARALAGFVKPAVVLQPLCAIEAVKANVDLGPVVLAHCLLINLRDFELAHHRRRILCWHQGHIDTHVLATVGRRSGFCCLSRTSDNTRTDCKIGEGDLASTGASFVKPVVLPLLDQHPASVQNSLASRAHRLGLKRHLRLDLADGELVALRSERARPDHPHRRVTAPVSDSFLEAHDEVVIIS